MAGLIKTCKIGKAKVHIYQVLWSYLRWLLLKFGVIKDLQRAIYLHARHHVGRV